MSDPMPPSAVIEAAKTPAGNVSTDEEKTDEASEPAEAKPPEPVTLRPNRFGGHALGAPTPPPGASSARPAAPAPPSNAPPPLPGTRPNRFGGHALGAPTPPVGARATAPKPKPPTGSRVIGQAVPASQLRPAAPASATSLATAPAVTPPTPPGPAEKLRQAHKLLTEVLPDLAGGKAHKPVLALLEPLSAAIKQVEG